DGRALVPAASLAPDPPRDPPGDPAAVPGILRVRARREGSWEAVAGCPDSVSCWHHPGTHHEHNKLGVQHTRRRPPRSSSGPRSRSRRNHRARLIRPHTGPDEVGNEGHRLTGVSVIYGYIATPRVPVHRRAPTLRVRRGFLDQRAPPAGSVMIFLNID